MTYQHFVIDHIDEWAYIGDAVYARFNEYGVLMLITWDGIGVTNVIYLEPTVIQALLPMLEPFMEKPR